LDRRHIGLMQHYPRRGTFFTVMCGVARGQVFTRGGGICQLCIAESHSEHPHEPVQACLNDQREAMFKAFLDASHLMDRMEKTLSAIPDHIRSIGLDDSAIRGDTVALVSSSSAPQ
jgi:hypothetical protein